MTSQSLTTKLLHALETLPTDALVDLDHFIDYLQFRSQHQQSHAGLGFLHAITGLGSSSERDVSERDEEILTQEIDPVRGWTLNREGEA